MIHSEVGRLEYDCIRHTRAKYLDKDWIGFKPDDVISPVPQYVAEEVAPYHETPPG